MVDRDTIEGVADYGTRVKRSFTAAMGGIALFLGAFPTLFWNEGRAVSEREALAEGAGAVVAANAKTVEPANEGKLVHIRGWAKAEEPVVDPVFGVRTDGFALSRGVEMYQWSETTTTRTDKQPDGSEKKTTVYDYVPIWSGRHIDSSQFREPQGRANPALPFSYEKTLADTIRLGAFTIAPTYFDSMAASNAVVPRMTDLPPNLAASFRIHDGALVTSKDPVMPAIGDVRVRFTAAMPRIVSLVGVQRGERIEPFVASNGREIALVEDGHVTAAQMFAGAQEFAQGVTWTVRGAGVAMMWGGLVLALGWIAALLNVTPALGRLVEGGVRIVAALIALPLAALTIAIAWLFTLPYLSAGLAIVAVGAVWLLRRRAKAALPPPPPPPLPSSPPPPPLQGA